MANKPASAARRATIAVGAVAIASVALVTIFLAVGGPADSRCVSRGNCYCEPVGDGLVRQPLNTWSSLVFVALGMWALFLLRKRANSDTQRSDLHYLFLFPAVTFWLGPAAFVFHMTVRSSAGAFDQTSILVLLSYAVLINTQRIFGWPGRLRGLLVTFVAGVLLLGAVTVGINAVGLDFELWAVSDVVVSVLGISTIALTIVSWSGRRSPKHFGEPSSPGRVLFPTLIATAMAVWALSGTGAPLCNEEFFAGHAAWHVLAALALGAAFRGWLDHPRGLHRAQSP